MIQRRNRKSNDYHIKDYMDKLPYDILPPPLPPYPNHGHNERIYETIMDPPCMCTSERVPYIYLHRRL